MKLELAAEVVYEPEKKAEDHAKQETGDQGKRDGPAATAPIEVSGEATQWNVEAVEAEHNQPRDDEEKTKKDKDAANIRHEAGRRLACG